MNKRTKDRVLQSINFTTFYLTACKSVSKIEDLNRFFKEKKVITLDDEDTVKSIVYATERLSITTIVFCTMTLESFINHYGSLKLTKPYFDDCLDKLDLKSKWSKIPKIVTGKQIHKGGEAFFLFSNLIELRNKLVHDKIKIKKETLPEEKDYLWETDAYDALKCVKLMIEELQNIDNSIYTDWIL